MIDLQEQKWIRAAQTGDQAAFAELIRRYEARVFALTRRMCSDPSDAEEAAQEAFLAVWQGLPSFRAEASFSTWLYRLTSNACIDLLRRENRHRSRAAASLDDEESWIDAAESEDRSPHALAEREDLRDRIEAGLKQLTPEHREVLILREMHQLSYEEIAEITGADLGTVKSRISRARRQLRGILLQDRNFSGFGPSKEAGKEDR